MKRYMLLPGILALVMSTDTLMAQAGDATATGSAPAPATNENSGADGTPDQASLAFTPSPLPYVDSNAGGDGGPADGGAVDATETDSDGIAVMPPSGDDSQVNADDTQDMTDSTGSDAGSNDADNSLLTQMPPDAQPPQGSDDSTGTPGTPDDTDDAHMTDGNTGSDADGSLLSQMPPDSQPPTDIDNDPNANPKTTLVTQLPYTIKQPGSYSIAPKAVYNYLWRQNDLPSAIPTMITLALDSDGFSSGPGVSISIDFNGAVISDCLGTCNELALFGTTNGYPQTNSENITIKNLTINRGDVNVYDPGYQVIRGRTQYLTLINVNRGGTNLEVSKSDAVYQTTIFNSVISEKGATPSIDQYRGCLTAIDSRFENKEIRISDASNDTLCDFHRFDQTMVSDTVAYDKLDRPFRITNGYIDNSEFNNVIVDMNTSHDFHIDTGGQPTPIDAAESLCTGECGIIDENGVLHWGFQGNEALWLANKRSE
ncbi:hypothetical protein [Thiolapillus sp.]